MNTGLETSVGLPIAEHVADLLGSAIIMGSLQPGERLTEEEVAATHRVSRSPVREGLRLLERDGLVRRSARRGIWVAPLSLRDFNEVYLCRTSLEGLAAQEAASSPDARGSTKLFDGILSRLQAARTAQDIPALFKADIDGSKLIYRLSGNVTLQRLLGTLEKQALRYRFYAYNQSPAVVQQSLAGSARIFKSICAGDGASARRLTEALINGIWRTMQPVIASTCPQEM